MRIIAADYNTQKYNAIKHSKSDYTLYSRIERPSFDSFERASKPMQNDISFNGLFRKTKPEFPPAVPAEIDKDIEFLTEPQKKVIKSQVALEINELLFSKKCTPEKKNALIN